MPEHQYECRCEAKHRFTAVVAWDAYVIAADCGELADRIYVGAGSNVIDDTLPGGPRWMHNLGDKPVWVETRSQYKEELTKRGLVQAERKTYNSDDRSPYATRTRLRPGARDPFLQGAG